MALAPINPTNLTPPRVALIDERSGAISREWYRFFLSLLTATETTTSVTDSVPDTQSLVATLQQIVDTIQNEMQSAPEADVSGIQAQIDDLQQLVGVQPPASQGSVTSVDASGGVTGLSFTGGPITTSGTLTLGGTLGVPYGGTGQTSYTNGQLLIGNTTGNTLTKATLTAGTNVSITNGAGSITINAADAFTGTVTSVSVVSANGFAGTVATATTTPAITISTSVTGLVKGNGTALSAAVAATDYVAPSAYASANGLTMATSRLLGRTTAGTGAAEEISVAGGLTLSAGVLTGASGTVTSVTGTSPVVSSGGTTPAISMPAATASVNGYLTSTDWTTFNNKGSGTVTSVAALTLGTTGTDLSSTVATGTTTPVITLNVPTASATNRGALSSADWITFNNKGSGTVTSVSGTGTVNGITLTGTVTSSGSLTLGGTLSNVSLTTQVTGTLPVANGGTGTATTFTAGSVVFAGASGVYSQDNANFFWDDTNNRLGLGTLAPVSSLHVDGGIGTIARFGASGALVLRSAAGTQASPTQIVTSTTLAIVVARGYDGAAYRDVGNMGFVSDGTISSTSSPGYIQFSTTSSGSTTAVERARIDSSGNVGIGATANASAILDVQSTTKGFRLPNMTTTQKNAISSPAAGLMVFDTTLSKACVYSGAAWETITSL
jgi:hypothetical protein